MKSHGKGKTRDRPYTETAPIGYSLRQRGLARSKATPRRGCLFGRASSLRASAKLACRGPQVAVRRGGQPRRHCGDCHWARAIENRKETGRKMSFLVRNSWTLPWNADLDEHSLRPRAASIPNGRYLPLPHPPTRSLGRPCFRRAPEKQGCMLSVPLVFLPSSFYAPTTETTLSGRPKASPPLDPHWLGCCPARVAAPTRHMRYPVSKPFRRRARSRACLPGSRRMLIAAPVCGYVFCRPRCLRAHPLACAISILAPPSGPASPVWGDNATLLSRPASSTTTTGPSTRREDGPWAQTWLRLLPI